jgi:alpha-tubulin suppressor-like RCC1 family protein
VVRSLLALSLCLIGGGCQQLFGLDRVPDPPKGDGAMSDTPPGACGHQAVATGRRHSCAIDAAGAVWCWGLNDAWQVKAGEADLVLAPVRIDALPSAAVQIAAGRSVSCARLLDGSVWCWGRNENGELGRGTQTERQPPAPVDIGGDKATDVDIGAYHVCIRRESDGAALCWGSNALSELGATSGTTFPSPVIVAGTAGMQKLSVGHRHNCGLTSAGTVQCWGKGDDSQLGSGTANSPVVVQASGISNATAVSAAGRSTCVVAAGAARCWGSNDYGQLGTGSFIEVSAPGSVVAADVVDIAVGTSGACALATDGHLDCWGALPPGDGTFSTSLIPRPGPLTSVSAIAAGFGHACAIADGTVQCWGDNSYGTLGRGTRDVVTVPTAVTLPANVTAFAVGGGNVCALLAGDVVSCWGANRFGELGDGSRSSVYQPVTVVTGITGVVGIAARFDRACAWNTTAARCWGDNSYGILGTGVASRDRLSPQTVTVASNLKRITLGSTHTCAITSSNTVSCWGHNHHGELGNNTTTDSLAAVTVQLASVTQLEAGQHHTCALLNDGSLHCWGDNATGQVGNNSTTDVTLPTPVSTLSAVTDVSLGRRHTCAIAGGNLYCWGSNDFGQLGLGSRTTQLQPVQLALPAPAVDVEAGFNTTCARLADDTVYCWGEGSLGQIANGQSPGGQLTPAQITLTGAGAIDALGVNEQGGCVQRAGKLECWGVSSMLADGNVTSAEPHPTMLMCP